MPPSVMFSPPLRIELRPSRAIRVALVLLAGLAILALWLSAAPPWVLIALPLLLALSWPRAPAHGWRELVLRADGTAVALNGAGEENDVVPFRLQRRGPLTVLSLHESLHAQRRLHAHLFTPATLAPDERRRLSLWFQRHVSAIGEATAHV